MKQYIKTFENYPNNILNESYETVNSISMVKFFLSSSYIFKKEKDNKFEIWKGIVQNDTPDFFIINTTDHFRKSAYTETGYYNLWIDNHEDWKKYPKRSKSIIATTNSKEAWEYGNSYRLFPLGKIEDLKIGICPKPDMWDSFQIERQKITSYGVSSISSVMSEVDRYYRLLKINDQFKPKNYEDLIDIISEINKKKFKLKLGGDYFELLEYSIKNNIPLLDVYRNLLSPTLNDFRLITNYNDLQQKNIYNKSHEIWLETRCLAIKESAMQDYEIDKLLI
jgi:hypothetical protein